MATITQKISSQTCHFTRSILHIRRAACSPSRVQTDLYAFPQVINTRHKVSSTRMEKRREGKKSWKKKKKSLPAKWSLISCFVLLPIWRKFFLKSLLQTTKMFREFPPLPCNYPSLLETNAGLGRTKAA